MLIRLSQPQGLFVSVEDIKGHTVIDTDDDDALLEGYIKAATRLAEDRTGRILQPVDLEWRADSWAWPFSIPAFPIRDVSEVAYADEDNAEQILDAADWYFSEIGGDLEVRFTDTFASPSLSSRPGAVRVRFSAGYDDPSASGSGDDPALAADPMDRLIVMLLVAHWYARRESVAAEAMNTVPWAVEALIGMRRIYR